MRRIQSFAILVMLLAPVTLQAQKGKPGGNVWIRSAQLYMDQALQKKVPGEQEGLWQKAYEQASLSTQKDPGNAQGYLLAGESAVALKHLAEGDSLLRKA